jgi:xanthine dehydrogenase accessory factor
MHAWLAALADLEGTGEASVLVTVVTARGSAPREAGCKMVVTRDTQYDTVGGGNLEFTCVETARRLLQGANQPVLRDFPLGPALGQCCGGHVSVLFEPLRPALSHVAVFGAGHVGRALVALLAGLPVRVRWIDTRADALAGAPANVEARRTTDPAREVAALPAGSIVLVMTHDHQIDLAIVAAALPRPDLAAIGLIGSETKRARFVRRLTGMGVTQAAVDRLICPIGIPGAGGKLPAEIAISAAAQILQIQQEIKGTMQTRDFEPAAGCADCVGDCAQRAVSE